MKYHNEPRRALSANFTNKTLRRAIKAERQANRRAAIKGVFFMKKQFWKQPVGAFVALALVVLGGTGVYAATNWFNGGVKVTTDNSILTVDLSECKSAVMPAGIEPTANRKEVKFKILGTPHIEAKELEPRLLADCEMQTVREFYHDQYGQSINDYYATIKEINQADRTVTLAYRWGGIDENVKTFPLEQTAAIYDKGQPSSLSQLKPGDIVTFVYDLQGYIEEGQNPFDRITALKSLFKMQYDTRQAMAVTKAAYTESNIMPLDQYNQWQETLKQ
jgi:hypothetical protein